jgi:hypothetical protein
MKKTRVALTHGQVYKLYDWCEKNKDLVMGKTIDQSIVIASRELDFKLVKRTLTMALDELNIFYTKPRRGPKTANKVLKCQIRTLAIAIKEIYDDMGSKVHPGIADIITLYTKE